MRGMLRLLPVAVISVIHQRACGFTLTGPTSSIRAVHPSPHHNHATHPSCSLSNGISSIHNNRHRSVSRHYLSADNDIAEQERLEKVKKINNTSSAIQSDGVYGSVAISPLDASQDYMVAIKRTFLWVGAAVAFGVGLSFFDSPTTSEEFFAGYLLEQSLSIDNLLVFLLLFEYFRIPPAFQNRVLNWGIFGAIFMRAIMIGAGAVAIQKFHAVLLVFASILIYSSGKILLGGDDEEEEDFSQNLVVQASNKFVQSTDNFDGDRFFTDVDGVRLATPMFLCMVAVELSDVIFAVDSIPAVFGVTEVSILIVVTLLFEICCIWKLIFLLLVFVFLSLFRKNPLVVFTSNMFAIMGLRSLYTILSKAASELEYLEPAVAIVLGFIGTKMVAEFFGFIVPTELSLAVVGSLLGGGVLASILDKGDEIIAEIEIDED